MNADSEGLKARNEAGRNDPLRRSRAKAEAALDYIATRIAPKFGVLCRREIKCGEGATEISPGIARTSGRAENPKEADVRATLGKRPTKQFSLSSSNEEVSKSCLEI